MTDHMKIRGKVYREVGMDEISLMDLMLFDAELAAAGLPYRWSDVERIGAEVQELTPEEAAKHPDVMFMTATSVWMAMRAAGEEVSLVDAARIPFKDLEFVKSPGDHQAKANPTKRAAKKSAPTQASEPVA